VTGGSVTVDHYEFFLRHISVLIKRIEERPI